MTEFVLDRFQREAITAIQTNMNVLVSAPTGSGKTRVAEGAIEYARDIGVRCFYTTPIKALSNQKYHDLCDWLGTEEVGLLTGDHSINPDASVVVMTTEVLRNMMYSAESKLDQLGWVILDEVHFLQDTYRGPVWEEILIHLASHVKFVCLSATISNADELGAWITERRGPTEIVIEEVRPVPLTVRMMVRDRFNKKNHWVPLKKKGKQSQLVRELIEGTRSQRPRGYRSPRRFATPRRDDVVYQLRRDGLLPVIYFIFSRRGCDDAAQALHHHGVVFTSEEERSQIAHIAHEHVRELNDNDLQALEYDRWLRLLQSGIAAHHAGMVPAFREAIEQCFVQGLLRVVFATETLALGINMPARSVVIERLTKFNGETHEMLSAAQFTQLTGRAGRRGIDDHGDAVVLWSPFIPYDATVQLASSSNYPLVSAFRPTYNMTANLVDRFTEPQAQEVLRHSFAQFQRRSQQQGVENRLNQLDELRNDLIAELFPTLDADAVRSYIENVLHLDDTTKRVLSRDRVYESLLQLQPGDVIVDPERMQPTTTTRPSSEQVNASDLIVILSTTTRKNNRIRIRATDPTGKLIVLSDDAFEHPTSALDHVNLPYPIETKSSEYRRLASQTLQRLNRKRIDQQLSELGPTEVPPEIVAAETHVTEHPLHAAMTPVANSQEFQELLRASRNFNRAVRKGSSQGASIIQQFHAITKILQQTGHLSGWSLTPAGEQLRGIYHECDLLISLCATAGLFADLDTAEFAALASCFVYEQRSMTQDFEPVMPSPLVRERFESVLDIWEELNDMEEGAKVPLTREPDAGFAATAWVWARGDGLSDVLDEDLTGGDFVRTARQLGDLLRQLGTALPTETQRSTARAASGTIERGVVVAVGSRHDDS